MVIRKAAEGEGEGLSQRSLTCMAPIISLSQQTDSCPTAAGSARDMVSLADSSPVPPA